MPTPEPEQTEDILEVENSKPLQALLWRRRWKKLRWLLWLLFMLPVGYFVVQLFIILAPRMRTEVVMMGTMTDSVQVTGQVVFNSTPVYGQAGHLYYTVPAGQRVAAGAEVAYVFSSEAGVEAMDALSRLEEEIAQLEEAAATHADGGDLDSLLNQLQTGLYGMLQAIDTGDYAGIEDPARQMALAANKIQVATGQQSSFQGRIQTLVQQQAYYRQQAVSEGAVVVEEGGYFAVSGKLDRIPLELETLLEMEPTQLQRALQAAPRYYSEDVVGHLVADYKWHFFCTVEARLASRFMVGDKSLRLSFPDHEGLEVPVTVEAVTVDEQENLATIQLYCDYIGDAQVLGLRVEKANIIFGEVKGIRIDKNALRLVDVPQADGSVQTLRGVYVQVANMVYFRRVNILVEDELYMLVPSTTTKGVNEVELYDTVVVDGGGVELYDRKIL